MPRSNGIWRFRELLPVLTPDEPVSLGEGGTPLIHCRSLGTRFGYPSLYIKNESQNPTGSFKDRLACAVVNHGIASGQRIFVWSSSGNAGTSIAAYAARAGATSIGLMSSAAPGGMSVAPKALGALIVMTPDKSNRQSFMDQMVSMGGYPTTNFAAVNGVPVGSNPFGTEGYRTIAYEIFDDLGRAPDYVISPTCYGDQILGIANGFYDLLSWGLTDQMPRMVAAMPPAGAPACISTGRYKTAQTIAALDLSHGFFLDPTGSDEDVLKLQRMVSEREGLFLEPSSVAALLGLYDCDIPSESTVVVVGTASGLKDTRTTGRSFPNAPVADGEIGLDQALMRGYGVSLKDVFR